MATVLYSFDPQLAASPTAANGPKSLDNVPYLHQFRPNTRADDGAGAWIYSIAASDATPLDSGRKLTLTDDLYANVKADDSRLPQGRVVVRRTDGGGGDPEVLGIGVNFVVEYVEAGV